MACLQKAKCLLVGHDWFTEFDAMELPVYRICHCCGKYQQPVLSRLHFTWAVIEPDTITANVLRQRAKIETNLMRSL
jgi:hypothetical protein